MDQMIKETINTAEMEKLHPNLNKPSYSIPEVAIIIGVTRYRVRNMIRLNQIKAILAGKQQLILRPELERYLSKGF